MAIPVRADARPDPSIVTTGVPGGAAAVDGPVDVIVCGRAGHRDETAALAVAAAIEGRLPTRARLRRVETVGVDDLLSVRAGGSVVIVDALSDLRPGQVHVGPLAGLGPGADGPTARSARSLAIPGVLGLVDMIRGRPLAGVIVGIGGLRFGPGSSISPRVARGLPKLVEAVLRAVDEA